jgi:hypothetical protein
MTLGLRRISASTHQERLRPICVVWGTLFAAAHFPVRRKPLVRSSAFALRREAPVIQASVGAFSSCLSALHQRHGNGLCCRLCPVGFPNHFASDDSLLSRMQLGIKLEDHILRAVIEHCRSRISCRQYYSYMHSGRVILLTDPVPSAGNRACAARGGHRISVQGSPPRRSVHGP